MAAAGGPAAPAVALAHDQVAPALSLRERAEALFHRIDPVIDLAEDIGSRKWCRGLATMLALGVAAVSFWPDFNDVEAAPAFADVPQAREEFRSQTILPLALGGDTGRRMAPTAAVIPIASAPERPTVQMVATFAQGDSLERTLQRAGVGAGDSARVAALVASAVPSGGIAPGTRIDLTLGRRTDAEAPRPLEKLAFRARFDLALGIDRRGGELVLERRAIPVDATPLRIQGTVGSSLYRSARAAGVPIGTIRQYLQALDSHLSLEGDIDPSDRFDIVVAHRQSASGESEAGELLYAGLERGGKPRLQLLRWGKDGQLFEASGMAQGSTSSQLFAPVAGRITSGYGMRRHPILGYSRLHAGIDFGAAWGAPIFAAGDGVVQFAGRHGGHGNFVRLDHGGGFGTGYAHMSRIAVSPGTRVRGGQLIGYVGSTGLSTGPHLHYEVYKNGRTVDPLSVRFTVKAQVDAKELAAFKAKLAQVKAIKPGLAKKKGFLP